MSDPLDAVFVTDKDEAQRLKRSRQLAALAKYLDSMPMELKPLFKERFSLVDNTELAQLRADLQAAQERIAAQAAIIREQEQNIENTTAREAAVIENHRRANAEQARKLDKARKLEAAVRTVNDYEVEFTACPVCDYPPIVCECAYTQVRDWLAANPAPQVEQP